MCGLAETKKNAMQRVAPARRGRKVNMESLNNLSQISGKLSRRKAIRARCIDCSTFIRSEVRECNFIDCLLHPYRSGRGKQNPVDRDRAIRQYCLDCMGDSRHEVKLCPTADCPLFHYRMTRKSIKRRENTHIGGLVEKKKSPTTNMSGVQL